MRKRSLPGLLIASVLLCTFLCLGDTIYLKNGETIRTSFAEIQGDKVIFNQLGGTVAIPMSLVDRIERDKQAEPFKEPGPPPLTSPSTPSAPSEKGVKEASAGEKEASKSEGAKLDAAKRNSQYWIKRKQELTKRLAEAEKELEIARGNNFAMRYAGGVGLERTHKQVEALDKEIAQIKAELANLEFEARKYGILPGVFRE